VGVKYPSQYILLGIKMQLQLLDVEEFIIKNRLGEVTSSNIYSINKNNRMQTDVGDL